jgi:hypothetical protein
MHAVEEAQETASKGGVATVEPAQLAPPSLLETAMPADPELPTATQVIETHETASSHSTTDGTASLVQLDPSSSEDKITALWSPPDAQPTATHTPASVHETARRERTPRGTGEVIQVVPASTVDKKLIALSGSGPPGAWPPPVSTIDTHALGPAHAMPPIHCSSSVTASTVHVAPSSVVFAMAYPVTSSENVSNEA